MHSVLQKVELHQEFTDCPRLHRWGYRIRHWISILLADNAAAQAGGGIWVYVSSAEIRNSIVWGNQPDAMSVPSGATASVSYSDITGGWEGDGNLNLNHEFTGGGPDPYALGALSPCADSGDPDTTGLSLPELDLAGNARIANGRVDMGGYEFADAGGVFGPMAQTPQLLTARCAPNPFSPRTTISYELRGPAAVSLRICDLEGRTVRLLLDRIAQEPRQHGVSWDGRNAAGRLMPSGTYLYVLSAGEQQLTHTVTLLR